MNQYQKTDKRKARSDYSKAALQLFKEKVLRKRV